MMQGSYVVVGVLFVSSGACLNTVCRLYTVLHQCPAEIYALVEY
jgi:hypothetical protein